MGFRRVLLSVFRHGFRRGVCHVCRRRGLLFWHWLFGWVHPFCVREGWRKWRMIELVS